ncbi:MULTISPECIES: amidohydrolase/deacetylase family metallohydrolase [Tatumella]|uniref:Amidohydrolase/deacetylase family metallohydrolase n=1 Tax=Tatumella punctata TaxID=399969 RepID=A0ABW1VLZ8_9GAMM|nr:MULTISPECIES: amidohydrolase/deacetylase family metallohydrolase [unclassified Tatumella]MBS0876623.1 amidohydrolase/deacetylase family metallohydrolase [Tatumella sp. JGM82]MBS0889990.1 amidohydrolase/deacetylase family metallohydrolase [Tatumella sp. JGM94]MBS0901234.1 amidohydrolase/deacetylase family metallohydrolase [Tatumella sp. JGM100]
MFDFIIRGARLGDGKLADIAVQEGRIAALGQFPGNALREYPLNGRYLVSAGWIDCHVHCYPPSPVYHDEPDKVGVEQGVTTIIDAGSTGADNIGDFYQLTRTVRTCVYALLNIARCGIARQDELSALSLIDNTAVRRAIQDYPAFIVGLKARMSSSVVGDNGITPLLIARQMQQENPGLPLMVHLGNAPPGLDEITRQLRQGDIITHCFNGKPNQILTPDGGLKTSVSHALQRGVLLDVGHGSASFVFEVARTAIGRGILPDTISSDIYCQNRRQGPVRSLARVMSAFLHLGMTLSQVLDRVTCHPALALNLQGKGRLAPGADADLTIFDLSRDRQQFTDAEGNILDGEYLLRPLAAITGGHWCITDEGKKNHVFSV